MVVLHVNIVSITAFKSKCCSHISGDADSPGSFTRPLQLMQLPARKIHIHHVPSSVENIKLPTNTVLMSDRNASRIACLKEPL